MAGWRNW